MFLKSSVLSLALLILASGDVMAQHRGPGCGAGWRPRVQQQVQKGLPDGTIIMYYSETVIGKAAKVVTNGDKYTHVAIVLNDKIYEADWPAVKKSSRVGYGKPKSTMDFFYPKRPFTKVEVERMVAHAEGRLGEPYRLMNYFHPFAPPVHGTWCSRFAGDVLNSSKRYDISKWVSHEPQDLLGAIRRDYKYVGQYRP